MLGEFGRSLDNLTRLCLISVNQRQSVFLGRLPGTGTLIRTELH